MPSARQLISTQDEKGFYGRNYYEHYLPERFGLPTLAERARSDLPERCLYWLRTLLTYKLPPAKVLEVGSAHGGFVALLRWAGFDATGLEVSPWLVQFAQRTFEVPTLLGPVERQTIEAGSLDVVTLLDVAEHLREPVTTMRRCVRLLKPDGLLLIQTPCYHENQTLADLERENAPFLKMMVTPNHLYLFSRTAILKLLEACGVRYTQFHPALFSYDMFLAASPAPLAQQEPGAVTERLLAAPQARMVQALLDLDEQYRDLQRRYAEAEADRAARLEVIHQQGRQLGELDAARKDLLRQQEELEAARASLARRCEQLEAARTGLVRQLEELRERLNASESDRAARLEVIHRQGRQLSELDAARTGLLQQLEELRQRLLHSESDRAARLEVIHRQGRQLIELEASRTELVKQTEELRQRLMAAEADRAARLEVIHGQGRQLSELEAARTRLLTELEQARRRAAALEAERGNWVRRAEELARQLQDSEQARAELAQLGEQLRAEREAAEARAAEAQHAAEALRAELATAQSRLAELERWLAQREEQLREVEAQRERVRIAWVEEQETTRRLRGHLEGSEQENRRMRAELELASEVLRRLRHSWVYRGMRGAGLWRWLAVAVDRATILRETVMQATRLTESLQRNCTDSSPNHLQDKGR